jgi:predicted Zn-dependent protease with MMP-like domain
MIICDQAGQVTYMQREKFEELVDIVVSRLPEEFRELLENIDIIVEDWPSKNQVKRLGLRSRYSLLGLYEGTPRTERGQNYNLALPDKITIFQRPLESQCRSLTELKAEISRTVKHEIAHYFGIDDERLRKIERRR